MLTMEDLMARIQALENAIRTHRDAHGDDRCWLDDVELYKVLGEDEVPKPELLALTSKDAFLTRCNKYWEHRQKPGCQPWKTVEALEACIADLEGDLKEAQESLSMICEQEPCGWCAGCLAANEKYGERDE